MYKIIIQCLLQVWSKSKVWIKFFVFFLQLVKFYVDINTPCVRLNSNTDNQICIIFDQPLVDTAKKWYIDCHMSIWQWTPCFVAKEKKRTIVKWDLPLMHWGTMGAYKWSLTWDFQQCGMCDQQSLSSACSSFDYNMSGKLLTERHLVSLSVKRFVWVYTSVRKCHIVGIHVPRLKSKSLWPVSTWQAFTACN